MKKKCWLLVVVSALVSIGAIIFAFYMGRTVDADDMFEDDVYEDDYEDE